MFCLFFIIILGNILFPNSRKKNWIDVVQILFACDGSKTLPSHIPKMNFNLFQICFQKIDSLYLQINIFFFSVVKKTFI